MHRQRRIKRRDFIAGGVALGIAGCAPPRVFDPAVIGETSFKNRAAAKGLIFGVEVNPRLFREPRYRALLIADAGMLVPGNALKWEPLERVRDVLEFRGADAVARFGAIHGMSLRGHTLLWHDMVPDWLPGALEQSNRAAEDLVNDHIAAVAGRYRGRMMSWDVVNEAIEPDHGRSDGLRESLFLKALGPDYVEQAFRAAAQADPSARLVLNDYGFEWGWNVGQRRRYLTLKLLERLLKRDVPVHALGIQGHLDPGVEGAMDMRALASFCDEVADLGLDIEITELDARDTSVNGSLTARDGTVADAYARFLEVVLDQPATKSVLTWSITDRYSWLSNFFPRPDGDRVRGLPYDADYKRKPAWYAMAAAFDGAPVRSPA